MTRPPIGESPNRQRVVNEENLPLSLKIVAVLFIIQGVFSVIEMLFSLVRLQSYMNLGVLGLFIAPGLLRLSRDWRTCALVFICLWLIFLPIFGVFLLAIDAPFTWNLFGIPFGSASKQAALLVAAAIFALHLWQLRVLTRPDVRDLFGFGGPQDNSSPDWGKFLASVPPVTSGKDRP